MLFINMFEESKMNLMKVLDSHISIKLILKLLQEMWPAFFGLSLKESKDRKNLIQR